MADYGVVLAGMLDDDSLPYKRAAMDAAHASRPALADVFFDRGSGCVRLSGDASYADVDVVTS
jgi:hypothetical protein